MNYAVNPSSIGDSGQRNGECEAREGFPGANKPNDLNCSGEASVQREAGLRGSCNLPEQLGMSPSRPPCKNAEPL